ncbi:MAG: PorV/PorQ family protein [Elusimicrobia bacterium]|nr:PorV/PorQ family protein [Elusimicrobiota bacterium]
MFLRDLIVVTFFFQSCTILYSSGTSTSGGTLLKQYVGGRASSMGEAYVAISDDLYGLHYNPAGMANLEREFTCTYFQEPEVSFNYGLVGYGQNIGKMGVLAGSVFTYDAGKIEWEDDSGNVSKLSVQRDYLYTLGYAKEILYNFSVGVNAKLFSSTLVEKYNATAYGADIGGLYITPVEGLSVGTVMQNIGTPIKYIAVSDPMPTTFRVGVGYQLSLSQKTDLTVEMDIVKPNDSDIKENVGLECWIGDMLALRAGYKIGYDLENYSFGLGFEWSKIKIDYSMVSRKNLEIVHIFSVSLIQFGSKDEEVKEVDKEKVSEEIEETPKVVYQPPISKKERKRLLTDEVNSLCLEGMYLEALSNVDDLLKTEPTDNNIQKLKVQLRKIIAIIFRDAEKGKIHNLIRKSINSYLRIEGNERIAVFAIKYAQQIEPENQTIGKLSEFMEQEYPGIAKRETTVKGKTIIEQKLKTALDCIYNNDYERGIMECEDVLELEPDNVLALKRAGSAYYALNNKNMAIKMWKQAKKIDPSDPEISEFLYKVR